MQTVTYFYCINKFQWKINVNDCFRFPKSKTFPIIFLIQFWKLANHSSRYSLSAKKKNTYELSIFECIWLILIYNVFEHFRMSLLKEFIHISFGREHFVINLNNIHEFRFDQHSNKMVKINFKQVTFVGHIESGFVCVFI